MNQVAESVNHLNGLTVHTINTDKYKTNTIILMMKAPLTIETVSHRALLSQLFQNGTLKSPTRIRLRERLDEMYGATLSTDVQKKGEDHIITIRLDVANERYLTDTVELFESALILMAEIILEPMRENGLFPSSVVSNEKRSLIQRIESVYDDKMRYANVRVTEEMCQNEPFALTSFGTVEDVESITPESLSHYYEEILKSNQLDLYFVGAINEKKAVDLTTEAFQSLVSNSEAIQINKPKSPEVTETKVVLEEQDIKQGKLHMGFRTYTTYADDDYVAMQVYNGLFGGFSHSKLFLNVREKESLAYYAASRLESHKGIMMVMSGIEFNKYERAVTIINEQFDEMKKGSFSDDEIAQTKAMLKNQILETADVARGIVELSYHQVISGHSRTIDDWLEQLDAVTKDDIIRVANKVQLDTIYFLKGKEGTE